MPTFFDPDRFQRAAQRFVAFFRELEQSFVEREDLFTQLGLALLGREHVLITGPPGTGKSQIVSSVLRRIIDEKTGAPSVYSRQFTESTVQTDLVGPLDFKTLMDTGRTEHFTDEGMLGSVHAFLDEVFDGRDMLLRSALNLLHERELKHGARTTTGAIECAVMTSNRYLAEILEGSRDSLLAFVDRIAYVSFVPKGFHNARNLGRVLRRALDGGAAPLVAPLSIGDLDVLQAAADEVVVPDLICETLAKLIELLEAETAAAAKADPSFLPTRYLSTRTAVRAGRSLRAICVYDKLFHSPDRPLEVLSKDFAGLRHHLVLSGVSADNAGLLLARELDPRERRQLQILRTEREIFDRCLAKLPPVAALAKKYSPQVLTRLEERLTPQALRELGAEELLKSARELAAATMTGSPSAGAAAQKFREVAAALGERALRAGLSAHAGTAPEAAATEMQQLAAQLEEASPSLRQLARWLRGRALWLLGRTAALPAISEEAAVLTVADAPAAELEAAAEKRLAALERLTSLRRDLLNAGAELPADAEGDGFARAAARVEDELVLLLDGVFRAKVAEVVSATPDAGPREVLGRLTPALAGLDGHGARLEALGAPAGGLRTRIAARRLQPLVRAVFPAAVPPGEREAFVEHIGDLVAQLRAVNLEAVLKPADLMVWSASALARGADMVATPRAAQPDQSGFAALLVALGPPILETLVGVLTRRVWLDLSRESEQPTEMTAGVRKLLGELSPDLRQAVCAADVGRAGKKLAYLESWWSALRGPARDAGSQDEVVARVEAVVMSGFLRVVRDEAAPARAAADLRLLADVFPDAETSATEIAARAARLEGACTTHLVELLTRRADAAWTRVLARKA